MTKDMAAVSPFRADRAVLISSKAPLAASALMSSWGR